MVLLFDSVEKFVQLFIVLKPKTIQNRHLKKLYIVTWSKWWYVGK